MCFLTSHKVNCSELFTENLFSHLCGNKGTKDGDYS